MAMALFESVTFLSFVQSMNSSLPIFVTEFGIVTHSRFLHPSNIPAIDVTEAFIVAFVRLTQPLRTLPPIHVTDFGIVMLSKAEQFWNASLSIFVTELGIVTLARLVQPSNDCHVIFFMVSGMVTLVMPVQFKKAYIASFSTGQPPSSRGISIAPVVVVGTAG